MRRARVKVAPNLARKPGRGTPGVPAKPAEDATKSLTSPVAKTSSEVETVSSPVGTGVKESLRHGIEQRTRRDSTTKDIVAPSTSTESNALLKSPVAHVSASQITESAAVANAAPPSNQEAEAGSSSSMTSLKDIKDKKSDELEGTTSKSTEKPEPVKPGVARRSRLMKAKPNIVESRNRHRLNSVSESPAERRVRLSSVSDSDAENSKNSKLTPAAVLSPKPVLLAPPVASAAAENLGVETPRRYGRFSSQFASFVT